MKPVVLMYHGIVSAECPAPSEREEGAHLYDVSRENFTRQMALLAEKGLNACDIDGAENDGRNVVLTFDDGEANNIRNAFPILKQFGFKAYFFVVTGRIGKKSYMNWEELKELRDADMIIGSHGLTHRVLTELKDKDIEKELTESKLALETHLKIDISAFSVPRGFYDRRVLEIAKKAGYRQVFVSDVRTDVPEGCLGRVAVRHDWTLDRFQQALEGRKPVSEAFSGTIKNSAKTILGSKSYNWVRNFFVKPPPSSKTAPGKGGK